MMHSGKPRKVFIACVIFLLLILMAIALGLLKMKEAADVACDYIANSPKALSLIGKVEKCQLSVSGSSVYSSGSSSKARISIDIEGTKIHKSIAFCVMEESDSVWRIKEASLVQHGGELISIMSEHLDVEATISK